MRGTVKPIAMIEPLLSEYFVGDTLFLKIEMNSTLEFESSEDTYDASNQLVWMKFNIFEGTLGTRDMLPAREKFEHISNEGSISARDNRPFELTINNNCSEEICDVSTGLVPLQSGYYGIEMDFGYVSQDPCEDITLRPNFDVNNNNSVEFTDDLRINLVRIDGATSEGGNLQSGYLYFFKVTE